MLKYILGILSNLFNPAVSLFVKIDNKSIISRKAKVYGRVQVSNSTMGDYSYVGRDSRIIYANIGKFCSIAGGVRIGMGTHTLDKLSTSPIFTEAHNATKYQWTDSSIVEPFKRVKIGNDVWIGTAALIMGGVTIGDGAVVGAGAIVTKDVPPFAVVAGVPARVIRYRFPEDIVEEIVNIKWWNSPEKKLQNIISFFQQPVNTETIKMLKMELDNNLIVGGGI